MTGLIDQQLTHTFHRSIMLTACLAGLILASAEGHWFPSAITPAVAVVAWIFVEETRKFYLPILAANLLGLTALMAAGWEFVSGNIEAKLLSGAHLLVYLNWIVLLLRKSIRQYWWVLALSLLQLAVSAVLTSSAGFGVSLIAMMFVLLWTLSVFSFYRVQRSQSSRLPETEPPSAGAGLHRSMDILNGLQRDPNEPWISAQFRGLVMISFLVSLSLSLIVFTAFPRVWVPTAPFYSSAQEQEQQKNQGIVHRTGFTEHVRLAEYGTILKNNERVLQFSIFNIHTKLPVNIDAFADGMNMPEVRFRGNALGTYRDGRWTRGLSERGYRLGEAETERFNSVNWMEPVYRLEVTQDPPVSQFAFAVFPLSRAEANSSSGRILQREATGSLIWGSGDNISPQVPRSFTIECPRALDEPNATFEHWTIPEFVNEYDRSRLKHRLQLCASDLFISPDLKKSLPGLYQLTQELCQQDGQLVDVRQRISRILDYLSPSNGFQYSLDLLRVDTNLDPVEDFLLNSRTGHCVYFASACTLMMQSAGIPARLVNGFSGGETNTVSGRYEIRQHHAHAWVEVFAEDRWETIDPTPGSERQLSIAEMRSDTLLSDLQNAISDLWIGGIHSLTLERQRAFFDPVLKLGTSVTESVREQGLIATVKSFISRWMTSPKSWFSWQGGLVTFILLSIAAAISRLHPLRRLNRLIAMIRVRFIRETDPAGSVIRFYGRFCDLCRSHGLDIQTASTAFENAHNATAFFGEKLHDEELRQLPFRIARAFNDVRFGHLQLTEDRLQAISRDMESWSQLLQHADPDKPVLATGS